MQLSLRSTWRIDWISSILTLLIAGIGLLFVYSATYNHAHHYSIFFKKQTLGIIAGVICYWLFTLIDYRTLMRWGYFAYFGVLALLAYTLIKGSIGMGAQRWIHLFFLKIQPSELAKPLFPAFISYYFYTHKETYTPIWRIFAPVLAVLALSFLLISKQPDLGTALIIFFSGLILIWLAGFSKKFFMYSALLCTLCAPLLWKMLKPYQKNRIAVFLGYGTTQKERYQIEQATIAVGSGHVWGKGLRQGTQNTLQFLPESRTDFIFAVLCEEWGFMGAFAIILLYSILFIRTLQLIHSFEMPHVQLLATGLLMHIMLSTFINIGMVVGLMPIVGIPLPFMSYGLSNLLISFASMGWIHGMYVQNSL